MFFAVVRSTVPSGLSLPGSKWRGRFLASETMLRAVVWPHIGQSPPPGSPALAPPPERFPESPHPSSATAATIRVDTRIMNRPLLVWRDLDVVHVHAEGRLRREPVDPRPAVLVTVLVLHLDGPLLRLGLLPLPYFAADRRRSFLVDIDPRFQPVPDFRRERHGRGNAEPLDVRVDLDLVLVSLEPDDVPLVDEPHLSHAAAIAVAHHVRGDRVVRLLRVADERERAGEEGIVGRLGQDLRTVLLADLPSKARADPTERGIAASH